MNNVLLSLLPNDSELFYLTIEPMQVLVKSRFSSYNSKNNTDITMKFSEDSTEVIHYKKKAEKPPRILT